MLSCLNEKQNFHESKGPVLKSANRRTKLSVECQDHGGVARRIGNFGFKEARGSSLASMARENMKARDPVTKQVPLRSSYTLITDRQLPDLLKHLHTLDNKAKNQPYTWGQP